MVDSLQTTSPKDLWPALDWPLWQKSADTLHMLTQIVGKTRLALTPVQNHWWNVTLYVTACGLSTSAMPLPGGDLLEIEFNFLTHTLNFRRGFLRRLPAHPLGPRRLLPH